MEHLRQLETRALSYAQNGIVCDKCIDITVRNVFTYKKRDISSKKQESVTKMNRVFSTVAVMLTSVSLVDR